MVCIHNYIIIADLIFKIKELKHPSYKRSGNDLIYKAKISLIHALSSQPIDLITLDGRTLEISLTSVIS